MARPRKASAVPVTAVLDREAVSALAHPDERLVSAKRAQAVLEAIESRGGTAVVPAPVLVEVSRGRGAAGVNRVLRASPVRDTDRTIAERAATSLEDHRLDSCHAVDALVVATAVAHAPVVILTADADDLTRLVGASRGVVVQALP